MNKSIDLRQFRYFLALCEELNFGRAAKRLHISQPPLTRQIQQLENQLGVELFVRGKTGVTLTPAGTAFLPEVRRTLIQVEKAIAAAQAVRAFEGGQFVVGYTTVFDRSEIPDVFDQLCEYYPGWQIRSYGKHSIRLVQDVKNGVTDAAFITLYTETLGLQCETIFNEPLVVALPANHLLARKRKLGLDDLNGEPMFWFERRLNPGYYDYCLSFFKRVGFKLNIIPEPADHHMLLGAIAQGQGLALMSTSLQKIKRKGVVFRALNDELNALSMGVAIIYSEHNKSPILPQFLTLVSNGVRKNFNSAKRCI